MVTMNMLSPVNNNMPNYWIFMKITKQSVLRIIYAERTDLESSTINRTSCFAETTKQRINHAYLHLVQGLAVPHLSGVIKSVVIN